MYSPISEYEKQHDNKILNENSTILIKEKEPSKYKRVRQKVPERPLSQISGKDVDKFIENFEYYKHNYDKNSSDLSQKISLGLKDLNPGKYRRQQKGFTERPSSQTSWEEIEKHMKSFELKINNPSFYNSEDLDTNHRPPISRKNLDRFDREEIRSIERLRSKNIKHKIEKCSLEAEKQSNSKRLNCDMLGLAINPGQSTSEKKYKRSERCVAERPFSQPSIKETEKYVKINQSRKNSPFLESNLRNVNLDSAEKNSKETKKQNPEKYQRKSQFTKRPSSQIFGTKIKEFIEIFEPETQCFNGAELNMKELDDKKGNLNKPDRKFDSTKYEGNQSDSADKCSSEFLRTHAGQFVESGEQDAQLVFHKTEEFGKNNKLENSNAKFKQISQRYSRNHVRNTRSASAPPIFIQTNVPNYFECSQTDNSKNSIARMKQNHNKESKNTDEAFSAELKCHEIPKCKTTNTSTLLDQKYKSEDLAMLEQKQSHVKNGNSKRIKLKFKEGKHYIPDFLVLESIYNRRPNKKVNEVIPDGGTVINNTDPKSEKYSRINKQNQRERRFDPSEILHKTNTFDLENTHMESYSSREIQEISSGDIPEKIPKTIKFDQNNNKINQLLMDGVQTNAPLYHLKLLYERKRPAPKEKEHKESSKILNGYKNNMHYHSSTDSLSSSRNPENEIPVNKKYVLEQKENQRHFAQCNKDMVPVADNHITQPLLKKKRSFFAYQNLETNINSTVPDSSEHSSDKNSFRIVAERNKNDSIEKSTENLDSSTDGMSSHARARNSQKQSSEIGKGPAKLDWSISEISVIENEGDDDKPFGIWVDGNTLLSPDENKSYRDDHKFSEKSLSNSFSDFSKELKRTFSSSQLNKNFPNVNKKLESLSKENEIDGVKCQLMLRKYFFLWKKKWRKHLAAKILWKRHSLRKGINALRQACQNSQIVSGVLQERIQIVWLRSCFQKWKQEASIKLWDQLAAAFKKWKENAKEQKRFQTLKDIHHRNVLLLCFQKWRSHYKSNIMLLRALIHHRVSLLYSMWHHWVQFVKQNQQKKFWKIMARKYQRKKLQSRTMKGLTSAHKNLIKAKLHYRYKTVPEGQSYLEQRRLPKPRSNCF